MDGPSTAGQQVPEQPHLGAAVFSQAAHVLLVVVVVVVVVVVAVHVTLLSVCVAFAKVAFAKTQTLQ